MATSAAQRPRIKPLDSTLRWGSHRPVLQTLFDLYDPRTALELGMGESSTPFLHARAETLISVENHAPWLRTIAARLAPRPGAHFVPRHHPLLDDAGAEVHFSTLEPGIAPATLAGATRFYRALVGEFGRFDLILVDQAASTRRVSLEVLAPHADLIVIHDTEVCTPSHRDFDCYRYNPFFESPVAAEFLHLRFDAITPWTDALIRATRKPDAAAISAHYNRSLTAYLAQFAAAPTPALRENYELQRTPSPSARDGRARPQTEM